MGDMTDKVAVAVLAKVPLGYGMTDLEATAYARAALSTCHHDELVEALKFYAAEGSWQYDTAPDPGFSAIPGSAPADCDHGETARAALAKVEASDG